MNLSSTAESRRRRLTGEEARIDNCREGHTGPVCGVCKDGYSLVEDLCEPCAPSDSFSSWPRARLAGFLFAVFFCFLVVSVGLLWKDIIVHVFPSVLTRLKSISMQVKSASMQLKSMSMGQQPASNDAHTGAKSSVAKALLIAGFAAVPINMVIETLQIIVSAYMPA